MGTASWQGRIRSKWSIPVGIVPDDKAVIPRRDPAPGSNGDVKALRGPHGRGCTRGLTPLDAGAGAPAAPHRKALAIRANKVDTQMQESLAAPFYGAFERSLFPVSAEHGYGFDNLLDNLTEHLESTESRKLMPCIARLPSPDEASRRDQRFPPKSMWRLLAGPT